MPTEEPIITIRGEKVALGPTSRTLLPLITRWMNSLETTRFLRMGVYHPEQEEKWFDNLMSDERTQYFTIYELPDLRPIGGVDLHEIDIRHRTAEVGIMIGEADARGKGYGTEATRLICDFGFNGLGLHSISLMTFEWNIAGQKAYEKAGFKEFGRRRESRWFNGRYWDDIWYDLLASEFESPVIKQMITHGLPEE